MSFICKPKFYPQISFKEFSAIMDDHACMVYDVDDRVHVHWQRNKTDIIIKNTCIRQLQDNGYCYTNSHYQI